ncbi:MAG: hypothetical protein MR648_02760 [Clostridiales bacterium]|nr:hypothetical protein [Clostridiales bacterium]MDY4181154.1 hypothetical protein [Pseudoflavonifractor sp.]
MIVGVDKTWKKVHTVGVQHPGRIILPAQGIIAHLHNGSAIYGDSGIWRSLREPW